MSLEGTFRKILKETGLDGYYYTFLEESTPHLIEGSIALKGFFEVAIKVDPKIDSKLEAIIKPENVNGTKEDLMYTVVTHENGHWQICPFDIEFLEEILAGVSKGLSEAGIPKKITPQRVWGVANLVGDIIVNIVLASEDSEKEKWKLGRGIKYLIEAKQAVEFFGIKFDGNGYPQDYSIFVDSQMRVYNPNFRWMASKFTKGYQNIKGVVKEAIAIFSDGATAKKAMKNPLDKYDLERIVENVRDISKWYDFGRNYARLTAPYQTEETLSFMTGGEGEEKEDKEEGGGEEGEGPENKKGEKEKKKEDGGKADNPFSKLDPDTIKKILQISIQKNREDTEMAYASQFEIYKANLEARAKDLIIDYTTKGESEARAVTISYLSSEKVEPKSMKKFKWSRTKYIITPEDEEWWFYQKILPLQVEGDFSEGVGSLIDVLFIVDKSGSMSDTHSCGKTSYELVEETIAACIKYLKNEQKAYYQKFGLILFGERDKNIFTGWQSYYKLDNFYKPLFEHHHPGDCETILNPNALNLAQKEATDQFLMIMVTDGNLHNTEQAATATKKVVEKGNFLTLFEIGEETDFGKKVKKFGQRFPLEKPEDLQGKMIKKVDEIFGSN